MKSLFVYNTAQYLYMLRLGLMEALKKKGFEVIFTTPHDEYVPKLVERGFRHVPVKMDRKSINPVKDIGFLSALYKIYETERPDIVFHFTPKVNIYGAIAARLVGVKCINTVTGLGYAFLGGNFLSKLVKVMYRVSFRFPSRIFFQNNDDFELFLRGKMASSQKAVVVKGTGVDVERFCPDVPLDVSNNTGSVFLFIGRILWDKGMREFVLAARSVKARYCEAEFRILGPIYEENPSSVPRKTVHEWEKEGVLKYCGTTDDVRPYIRQCDVMVLPSYREGMPRAVLEAMAMAKPVITSDVPGCRDTVEHGKNGFLVPAKDAEALAEAMIKFLELPMQDKNKMGGYSRERAVREFDEKMIIEIYMREVFKVMEESVLGPKRATF